MILPFWISATAFQIIAAQPFGVEVDVTHKQRGLANLPGEILQHTQVVTHEAVFGEQIARWVAPDGHFGRHNQISPPAAAPRR